MIDLRKEAGGTEWPCLAEPASEPFRSAMAGVKQVISRTGTHARYQVYKAGHSTRGQAGFLRQKQTDGPDREGSHSSIAQARQTQTQAKMMQRWGHQTAGSTFTVPMAALLCLPWLWVAVKHLTRRGANSGAAVAWGKCKRGNQRPRGREGATGSRCNACGDGVRAKKPEGPIWGGLGARWVEGQCRSAQGIQRSPWAAWYS